MTASMRRLGLLFAALLLSSCALTRSAVDEGLACTTPAFTIDDAFDGARRGHCRVRFDGRAEVTIVPEDPPPINDSAWYAFRVTPSEPGTAGITLFYEGGNHRYWPKISPDGHNWRRLEADAIRTHHSGKRLRVELDLDDKPVFVAAQPLILPSAFHDWTRDFASRSGSELSVLGQSRAGRPIYILRANADARDVVLFVGRQHPPEVTGGYGLQGFVEALFTESELARRFRERYAIVIVPFMNPDGAIEGHWRNNLGGKDLNRDWGPFEQPETRLVKTLIDDMESSGKTLRLFLDFHSTKRNVFYTQADEEETRPTRFADRWLEAAAERLGDYPYPFENAKRHNKGRPTSKNYMHKRFGIPAITYEVGDNTTREVAVTAAAVFAEEMMRLLVDYDGD